MGRSRAAKSKRGNGQARLGRRFTSPLNAIAYYMGGRKIFFDYARQSDNPEIQKVVQVYDDAYKAGAKSFQAEHFDIVDACRQVDIEPSRMLAEVTAIAYDSSIDMGDLISAVNFPKVVEATVKGALTARGVHDRKMLLQHHKFLPLPGKVVLNDRRRQMAVINNPTPADPKESEVPRFEDHVSLLGKAFRGELGDGTESGSTD